MIEERRVYLAPWESRRVVQPMRYLKKFWMIGWKVEGGSLRGGEEVISRFGGRMKQHNRWKRQCRLQPKGPCEGGQRSFCESLWQDQ
jgi:hypothetical protein